MHKPEKDNENNAHLYDAGSGSFLSRLLITHYLPADPGAPSPKRYMVASLLCSLRNTTALG